MSYYNTTNLSGADLAQTRAKCRGQEAVVMDIFEWHKRAMSPDEVLDQYHIRVAHDETPITSIRRAMTTLTSKGLLVKTENQVRGAFGKLTYTWKLAD